MTGAGMVTCFPLLLARAQRCCCRLTQRHSFEVLPPGGVIYKQQNGMRTSTASGGCYKHVLPPAGFTGTRKLSSSVVCFKKKEVFDGGVPEEGDAEADEGDREVEELFQEVQFPAAVPGGQQKVFIVHPDVKWGIRKQQQTTAELMMAEAVALVHTLDHWKVVEKMVLSTKTPQKKRIFGKGNFQLLSEKIHQTSGVTAVLVNVDRLSAASQKEFEDAWGVRVLDRYQLVLQIFRINARTKEAKLQISLAEIPLLRSYLKNEFANMDQQGGGARYIGGSGETLWEVQQRLLKERELKIRTALEKLRRKRRLLRSQRQRCLFPVVSVLGYTNCGKTTLIKALTGDDALQPRDQLFATLDVTVHAGKLPSHMTVLYVDTIGFLSQLPHQLIDSFSATLEDIKHSDLLIHIRDVSHPETENQKMNVLNVLKNLEIPDRLMGSIIEVHNKTDLIPNYQCSDSSALPVSALWGRGLDTLKAAVEAEVMKSTGSRWMNITVDLSTPQLSWLYREGAVQDVQVDTHTGTGIVKVLISEAAYGRYRKLFA